MAKVRSRVTYNDKLQQTYFHGDEWSLLYAALHAEQNDKTMQFEKPVTQDDFFCASE